MKLARGIFGALLVLSCSVRPAPAVPAGAATSQQIPTPPVRRVPDRRPVIVQGRVMGTTRMASLVEVRIESSSGVLNSFVFTEPSGRFIFRDVSLDPDDFYYIVAQAEGFETHRERLDYQVDSRRGGNVTIFLEPEIIRVEPEGSPQIIDLSQLMAAIPDDAREEFDRALNAIENAEYDEAVRRLEDSVEIAPDYFDALDALGAEYLRAGRLDDASEVLTRAMELSPASARPLLSLGAVRYRQGESRYQAREFPAAIALFEEAISLLEQSIRRDPTVAQAYHNLGQTQYRIERYNDAEESLQTALTLDPTHDEVRLALVNVYTRQYRYPEALEQVRTYLQRNPDGPQAEALERLEAQIEAAAAQPPSRP